MDLYIGRTVKDSKPLLYSSRDLVTQGVCVGMTGSGKTGLCIGLLEEFAAARWEIEGAVAGREQTRIPPDPEMACLSHGPREGIGPRRGR